MLGCSPLAFDPLATCTPIPAATFATIDIVESTILVPGSATICVNDPDRAGQGILVVAVEIDEGGDTDDIVLTETAPGVFKATVPFEEGPIIPNDGTIQIPEFPSNTFFATVVEQGGGTVTDDANVVMAAAVAGLLNRRTLFERRGGFLGRR